jgi:hypothetical protein
MWFRVGVIPPGLGFKCRSDLLIVGKCLWNIYTKLYAPQQVSTLRIMPSTFFLRWRQVNVAVVATVLTCCFIAYTLIFRIIEFFHNWTLWWCFTCLYYVDAQSYIDDDDDSSMTHEINSHPWRKLKYYFRFVLYLKVNEVLFEICIVSEGKWSIIWGMYCMWRKWSILINATCHIHCMIHLHLRFCRDLWSDRTGTT